MKDGLPTEFFEVSDTLKSATVTASTALSGADLLVAAAKIDATELAASSVDESELATNAVTLTKISAAAIDGNVNTLSSGSRWIAFRSAFGAPPFVVTSFTHNARTADLSVDADWVKAGSVAAGSFLALGSPATFQFNWIAIGSR